MMNKFISLLKGVGFSAITNCLFKPERFAIFVEEAPYHVRVRQIHEESGGWIAAANEKQFEQYYSKFVNNTSSKRPSVSGLSADLHQREYMISDSEVCDSDTNTIEARFRDKGYIPQKNLSENSGKRNEVLLDDQAKYFIRNVQGPVIRNVKISNGRGGITVCRLGQVWVENSDFHDLVYGIRCLQNSKAVILNNKIHSCETSGIFMREHATALVAGNHVFSNSEAGIDIRSSADPVIQHNQIHSGRRSGIVSLDSGKGLIRENDIYNNKEAGVYILYKGNPKVRYV